MAPESVQAIAALLSVTAGMIVLALTGAAVTAVFDARRDARAANAKIAPLSPEGAGGAILEDPGQTDS